ncbi:MAG: VOC family protein [Brevundimonas sp.]|nr:MAG: VOC family protein [Brevundimonas sp.]
MAYAPPDPPVVPYLMVHDGPAALDWYVRAFGAEVIARHDEADGRLGHATLGINGGSVYLADEFPELQDRIGAHAPRTLGSTTVSVALAVDDTDAWLARAVAEGATVIRPATDDAYGRHAKLTDPYGHVWSLIGPRIGD